MFDSLESITQFFSSPVFEWLVKGALLYLGVLWFAVVIWVARDIINRTNSLLFQSAVILLNIVLPVFGLLLYLIVRPTKTLVEKYYDELEYHFLNDQKVEVESCPRCEDDIQSDFLFCPKCEEQLKRTCWSCDHIFLHEYKVCPYCGKKERKVKRSQRGLRKKTSPEKEMVSQK